MVAKRSASLKEENRPPWQNLKRGLVRGWGLGCVDSNNVKVYVKASYFFGHYEASLWMLALSFNCVAALLAPNVLHPKV